jgi:hypothetical protein
VVRGLTDLVNITELEVQRAKDLFKTQILFGRRNNGLAYTKVIDRVTRDQFIMLAQLLASFPTLLALGGDTRVIPMTKPLWEILKGFSRRIKTS